MVATEPLDAARKLRELIESEAELVEGDRHRSTG